MTPMPTHILCLLDTNQRPPFVWGTTTTSPTNCSGVVTPGYILGELITKPGLLTYGDGITGGLHVIIHYIISYKAPSPPYSTCSGSSRLGRLSLPRVSTACGHHPFRTSVAVGLFSFYSRFSDLVALFIKKIFTPSNFDEQRFQVR